MLIAAVTLGCQTLPKIEIASLPPTLEGLFTICSGGEGSLSVSVLIESEFLGSALFDWVSDRERRGTEWNGEFRTALGHSILTVSLGGREIIMSGAIARQLPPIRIRPDGFLEIDGHFVGIKGKELPCLFKFRFPREWLAKITRFEREADRALLESEPDGRSVKVVAEGMSSPPARSVCAEVSWRRFFGMVKSVATFCHHYDKQKRSSLKVGSIEVNWIDIDEQAK